MESEDDLGQSSIGTIYILRNTIAGENEGEEIVETVQKIVHKLPEILKKRDGIFVMKDRTENIAIYRKIASFEGSLSYNHFEVIRVKIICVRDSDSKEILHFEEIYPRYEELGFYKFVFRNKYSAIKKFNELLEEYSREIKDDI